MSDYEDPKFEFDRICLERNCATQHQDYRKCLERISSKPPEMEAHCWGWYNEIVHCVDVCTHAKLWPVLK